MAGKDYTTFQPWFGDWPPEFRGQSEGEIMDDKIDEGKWYRRWPLMLFVYAGVVGLILLLASAAFLGSYPFWQEIVTGLAIAGLTAGIIGGIIELAFVEGLAEQVAKKTFGFLLPPAIREEISWIYGMERLIIDYTHRYRFEQCSENPDMVWIYESINHTVKNISKKEQEIKLGLGIQEWFHKEGRSQMLSVKITHEDGEVLTDKQGPEIAVEEPKGKQKNYILSLKDDKLSRTLEPGRRFTWVAACKELRAKSGETVSWSATAAMNPHVIVEMPSDLGIDYDLKFANRKQGELRDLGSDEWQLDSLLLPGQAMRIRWWPKCDSEKWREETYGKSETSSN